MDRKGNEEGVTVMTLFRWELSAAAVIIAVIILRRLLGTRLRPAVRMILWAAVAFRLLIPFEMANLPFRVPGIVREAAATPAVETATRWLTGDWEENLTGSVSLSSESHVDDINDHDMVSDEAGKPESFPTEPAPYVPAVSASDILRGIWLGGMAVLAVHFLWINVRLYRNFRRFRRRLPSLEGAPVYTVPGLEVSCVFCGSIYLPETVAEDEVMLRYVLAHETAHIRHGDSIGVLLRNLLRIFHWMNPLVWVAVVQWHEDAEFWADDSALTRLQEEEFENYSLTLIAQACRTPEIRSALSAALNMSETGKKLYERIRMMKPAARLARSVSAVLVSAVFLLTAFTFVGWQSAVTDGLGRVVGQFAYENGHLIARTEQFVYDADVSVPEQEEAAVLYAGYRTLESDWKEAAACLFSASEEELIFREAWENDGTVSSVRTADHCRAAGIVTGQSYVFYDDIPEGEKNRLPVIEKWLKLQETKEGVPCLQLYPNRLSDTVFPEQLDGFSREEACSLFLSSMKGFDLPLKSEPEAVLAFDAAALESMKADIQKVYNGEAPWYSGTYERKDEVYLLIWEYEYDGIPLVSARCRNNDGISGMMRYEPSIGGTVTAMVGRGGLISVQMYGQVFRETQRSDPSKIISLAEAVHVLEESAGEETPGTVRTVADIRLCYVPTGGGQAQTSVLVPCYVFSCFEGEEIPHIWEVFCVNALTGEILPEE